MANSRLLNMMTNKQKWDVFKSVFFTESFRYEPSQDFVEHWDEYTHKFNLLIQILDTPISRRIQNAKHQNQETTPRRTNPD